MFSSGGTGILEIILFAFACRLFQEDFSPLDEAPVGKSVATLSQPL